MCMQGRARVLVRLFTKLVASWSVGHAIFPYFLCGLMCFDGICFKQSGSIKVQWNPLLTLLCFQEIFIFFLYSLLFYFELDGK